MRPSQSAGQTRADLHRGQQCRKTSHANGARVNEFARSSTYPFLDLADRSRTLSNKLLNPVNGRHAPSRASHHMLHLFDPLQ